MRFVNNPYKGTVPGKADDDNESQWNSAQRAPKDGSASPATEKFGDRTNAPVDDLDADDRAEQPETQSTPFGGKSYN